MEHVHKTLEHPMCADRRRVLTVVWISVQVFAFCFIISALAVAGDSMSKAYNFNAIWLSLEVIAFSVAGTLVFQRARTQFNYGVLVGVAGVLSMQMLTLAVLSGGNVATLDLLESPSSEKSVVAFSVFLFLDYGILAILLVLFRGELAGGDSSLASQDDVEGTASSFVGDGPRADTPGHGDGEGYDPSTPEPTSGGAGDAGTRL